jgi:hypothetical protein
MAAIEKTTKQYPSDLTDEEWSAIWPFLPGPASTGRKRWINLREVLNAIRYMVRSGCARDDVGRRQRLGHAVTVSIGIFGAAGDDHPELRRRHVQTF